MASNPRRSCSNSLDDFYLIDQSYFYHFEDKKLVKIIWSFVDSLIRAGTYEWKAHSDDTLKRFETTEIKLSPLKFAGIHITESESMYHINPIPLHETN